MIPLFLTLLLAPPELAPALDNLNGAWRFATDPQDVGEQAGWAKPAFDDSAWKTLDAPGLWEPQGVTDPRPGAEPIPTTPRMRYTDYDGVAWYRRQVIVPAAWAGKPLVIRLGQVDDEDRTFVNGQLVGAIGPGIERAVVEWRQYDVSPELVRYGEVNTIAVRVTDLGGPGGLQGPLLSLLPADFGSAMVKLPTEDRPAAERFADPPGSCRILRLHHSWPQDPEAARMELLRDLTQGFGGVGTNVDFGPYVEDEAAWGRLEKLVAAVQEANGALWLYDEKGYPSGSAGGIVLRDHPEYENRGLLCVDGLTAGEALELTAPPGTIRVSLALPLTDGGIDLNHAVPVAAEPGGKLTFTPPGPGSWHVMIIGEDVLYEGTHATSNVFQDRRVPNLLLAESTDYFLQVTHDRYAQHFGQNLGQTFISTFTDEPSLMDFFMKPMPYRPLPFSQHLEAEFQQRWGEPLLPKVPLLYADGPGAEKFRHQFWKLIGEQVAANYFGQIRKWCDAHGIRSGGHLLYEEPLLNHVPFYGNFMGCVREVTAPSIDVLTSIPQQVAIHSGKLVSSVGELTGHTLTMSEASDHAQRYRREGDARPPIQVTIDQVRGSLHRQQLSGINTFTSYYQFGRFKTDELVQLNESIGRINTTMRGGHLDADIAVVYPVESVWPHFRPRMHQSTDAPGAVAIDQAYTMTHQALFETGRDYCFVDPKGLLEAQVEGDRLTHGELAWKVVILPGVETLPAEAWDKLDTFQKAGGTLIAVGPRPQNTDLEFPSPAVQSLDAAWFGQQGRGLALGPGQEALLPAVLDSVLERDVSWSPEGALKVTHRIVADHDVWLVINDSPDPWRGTLTVCGEGRGEVWTPDDGAMKPVAGNQVAAELGSYGAVILRYEGSRERKRLAGERPSLPEPQPLTVGEPTKGHGEFVDGTLAQIPGQQVWTATGVLTKSQVDTHLFVRFPLPQATDLSASRWLVVDTRVPDGRTAGPKLLVLAGDADGGTFLAEAGRSLGQPGEQRSYVPWDRFRPLGQQPKASNGVLDVAQVTWVSVGWGGHFGQEGDQVVFEAGPPMVAGGR